MGIATEIENLDASHQLSKEIGHRDV